MDTKNPQPISTAALLPCVEVKLRIAKSFDPVKVFQEICSKKAPWACSCAQPSRFGTLRLEHQCSIHSAGALGGSASIAS